MQEINICPAGAAITPILIGVVLLAVPLIAAYSLYCPCEQLPGVYLPGDEVEEPVTDWGFANAVPLCQIQVKSGRLPHAVNLNCMSAEGVTGDVVGGDLYLSCMNCADKVWSNAALANPLARLRLGENVYPVHLARLHDPQQLDIAWHARATKTGQPTDRPRPDHWWSFAVTSR